MMNLDRARQVLDVSADASIPELQRAYKQMLSVWAPERFASDVELQERARKHSDEIDAAYQALVTDQLREIQPKVADPLPPPSEVSLTPIAAPIVAESVSRPLAARPSCWNAEGFLVTNHGATLNASCIRCNSKPVVRTVRESLTYRPPYLWLLLFLGIIGWILIAVYTRRSFMMIGLCEEHSRRRSRLYAGGVVSACLWLLPIPLFFMVKSEYQPYAIWISCISFLVMLVIAAIYPTVSAKEIRDGLVAVRGVSNRILSTLPHLPVQTPGSHYPAADAPATAREKTSNGGRLFVVACYVIGVAVPVALLWNESNGMESAVATVFGTGVAAGIAALVVHTATTRRPARNLGFSLVAIVFAAMTIGASYAEVSDAKEKAQLRAAAQRASRAADRYLQDETSGTSTADADTSLPGVDTAAINAAIGSNPVDMTTVMNWVAGEHERAKSVTDQLARDREATGIQAVWSDEALTTVQGITSARTSVGRFRQYLATYRKVMQNEDTRTLATAETLNLSTAFREEFLNGLRNEKSSQAATREKYLSVESRLIEECEDRIEFLAERIGTVEFEDGKLLFRSDSDLEWYKGWIERVNRLSTEEDAVLQEMSRSNAEIRAYLEKLAQELQRK